MDLSAYTEEQLDGLAQELDAQRAVVKQQQQAVQAERDRRAALARLAALNPAERATLAQVLGAEGVPSGEALGRSGVR